MKTNTTWHIKEVLTQDGFTLSALGSICYLDDYSTDHHLSLIFYDDYINYRVRVGAKFYIEACTSSSYEDFDVVYPEFKRKCDILLTTALFSKHEN
jgi:hypothetical protein